MSFHMRCSTEEVRRQLRYLTDCYARQTERKWVHDLDKIEEITGACLDNIDSKAIDDYERCVLKLELKRNPYHLTIIPLNTSKHCTTKEMRKKEKLEDDCKKRNRNKEEATIKGSSNFQLSSGEEYMRLERLCEQDISRQSLQEYRFCRDDLGVHRDHAEWANIVIHGYPIYPAHPASSVPTSLALITGIVLVYVMVRIWQGRKRHPSKA